MLSPSPAIVTQVLCCSTLLKQSVEKSRAMDEARVFGIHLRRRGSGGAASGLPDYPGAGPPSRVTGFGSHPAIITNTTVEVAVPRAFVPSIYGEDGECLRQIRQISGAKITITEPRPGDTETVIIISGTPDQTHAAQSLLQAFVMSGQGSP
ncbi:Heterogeneous nuclear ribonucleoprotein K [Nymphaea thermarum]|nr:Heterogeneous nuclear ribonucleoprotein K [Nymphaea thermarum]